MELGFFFLQQYDITGVQSACDPSQPAGPRSRPADQAVGPSLAQGHWGEVCIRPSQTASQGFSIPISSLSFLQATANATPAVATTSTWLYLSISQAVNENGTKGDPKGRFQGTPLLNREVLTPSTYNFVTASPFP